jgi:proline iminopeptidase
VDGTGPVCLAHPAPGGDLRTLGDLAGLASFLTLMLLDPRGNGASSAPADPTRYDWADYAADIEALRRHLEVETFVLLGVSAAGPVVLQYALDHPEHLSHLILVGSAAPYPDEGQEFEIGVQQRQQEPWYPAAHAALDRLGAHDYADGQQLAHLVATGLVPFCFRTWDAVAQRFAAQVAAMTFSVEAWEHANSGDLRPRLPEVQIPTLLLCGEDDIMCPPRIARAIAELLPQAHLVMLEHCGHMPSFEQPERFHTLIRQFVGA